MYTITDPFTGEETQVPAIAATCTTDGCGNSGIEFTVPAGAVQCGACGEWIVPPEPPIEPVEPVDPVEPEPEEVP